MQNDVMKNAKTPAGIKNLISNSLVQHNQLQYNPSVSCRSNNPNELKPILHDHINTRFTKVPYKTEVRPEAYSNFVLNNKKRGAFQEIKIIFCHCKYHLILMAKYNLNFM